MAPVDTDADDRSPWTRDDWVGSEPPRFDALTRPAGSAAGAAPDDGTTSTAPDVDAGPPTDASHAGGSADGDGPASARPGPARPGRSRLLAVVVALAVVALAIVSVVRSDDDPEPADAAPATAPSVPSGDESLPPLTTTVDAVEEELAARAAAEERAAVLAEDRAGAAGGVTPVAAVPGEVPAWTEWSIEPAGPLASLGAPTEVVVLTRGGVLHVVELPSGSVRSLVMPEPNRDWKLAVSDTAVVVYDQRDLVVIRDERPVQRFEVAETLLFLQPWPSTSSFVATMTPSLALDAERVVVDADTEFARPVTAAIDGALRFGAGSFLASGELLVGRAGGVYAIALDGSARRLDDGALLAVGRNHYAVETCDESLQCADVVVDVRSGDRTPVELSGVAEVGFADPSTHLSPDGRSVLLTDATRGTGFRQILDAETGERIDLDRLRGLYSPDTWAADSSGVFTLLDGSVRFQTRRTVDVVGLDGLGVVEELAVRPA
jgi:hypothetical protein